jgi:hypothetical protein
VPLSGFDVFPLVLPPMELPAFGAFVVNAGSGASDGEGVIPATLAGLSLASELTGITAGVTGAGRSHAATVNKNPAAKAIREILLMCESVVFAG